MKENNVVRLSAIIGLTSTQIGDLATHQRCVERALATRDAAMAAYDRAVAERDAYLSKLGIVEQAGPVLRPVLITPAEPVRWATPAPQAVGYPAEPMPAPSALEKGAAVPTITELPAPPAPEAVVELVEKPAHEQEVKRPEAGLKPIVAAQGWKAWAAANGLIAIRDAAEMLGVPAPTLVYRLGALKIPVAEQPDRPTHRPTLYRLKDIEANREELAKPLRQKAAPTAPSAEPEPAPEPAATTRAEGCVTTEVAADMLHREVRQLLMDHRDGKLPELKRVGKDWELSGIKQVQERELATRQRLKRISEDDGE